MSEQQDIKIELYLSGKMSPEEVVAFEKEIASNKSLREEVEVMRSLNIHFSEPEKEIDNIPKNQYTEDLKTFLRSEDARSIKTNLRKNQEHYYRRKKIKSRRQFIQFAAAIALIVLGYSGYYLFNRNSPENLFEEFYTSNDLPENIRRGDNNDELTKITQDFKAANYSEVISYSNTINIEKATITIQLNILLYKGVSYLLSEQYDNAIKEFDNVIELNALDSSKGYWFKALTYLKKGDTARTKQTLELILENETNFNFEEANQLLEKI